MTELFSQVSLIDIHRDLTRNIVSLRVSENLFDDLTDDVEAWQSAQQLELDTKPKLFTNDTPIIHRPFEESEWNMAIGFPFTHSIQSRYSDGSYGVWYGAGNLETTVHETVYHWRAKLLADAEGFLKPGVSIERKVYWVRCDAALIDLRPAVQKHPELIYPHDYTATQAIGRKMHHEGHPGLVTQSARCEGEVYAIFTPNVLSNARHTCFLTYITTDKGIEVQKTPGLSEMTLSL
jgi:hypothetical protein